MKLYMIDLRSRHAYSPAYVVANDPTEAYNKLRKHLDDTEYGTGQDRELVAVHQIAAAPEHCSTIPKLFI